MNTRTPLLMFLAFLTAFLFVAVSPAAAQDPGTGEINLTLEPSDAEVFPGDVQQYDVVVEGPDRGIGVYSEVAVEVGDNSVANITGFSEANTGGLAYSRIRDGGAEVVLSRALFENSFSAASEITIATLNVTAVGSVGDSTVLEFNRSANQNVAQKNSTADIYTTNAFTDAAVGTDPAKFTLSDLQPSATTVTEVGSEQINISATVENTGDLQETQTVNLSVGSLSRQKQVTLSGGDSRSITFQNVDTSALASGEYTYQIQTANDTVSGTLTLQTGFQVSNVQLSVSTVEQGQRINVSADVQNVDDAQNTRTVTLAIGSVSASDSRTIAAGASETVTFENVPVNLGPGGYTPTVSTANDSANGATLIVLNQEVTVELRPVREEVRTFKNAPVQVVVTGAIDGIDAYDLDIALNNTNASLLDYELATDDSGVVDNSAISADNSSISLDAENASLTGGSETVIANLTLQFDEVGAVQASPLASVSINDTSDTPYKTSVTGTDISTFGPPPVVDYRRPPQDRLPADPDGDGLYEDVRGDGGGNGGENEPFYILDVASLFNNLDNPELQENAEFFSFYQSGNSIDEISILDVQALYKELPDPF